MYVEIAEKKKKEEMKLPSKGIRNPVKRIEKPVTAYTGENALRYATKNILGSLSYEENPYW